MKYLCMIYLDEKLRSAMSASEHVQLNGEALAYDDELRRSGRYVLCQALQDSDTAVVVHARNGKVSVTDGPFAETKEQLGGIVLLDARDLNEAIQLAARIPPGRLGRVEVRPVREVPRP